MATRYFIDYRKNGVWGQPGPQAPLVNVYADTITISADGTTLVGVYNLEGCTGKTIALFGLSGEVWVLRHTYCTDGTFPPFEGIRIALSGNGNTLVVGAAGDYSDPIPGSASIHASPQLITTLSHSGNFTQGQTGATYTISVKNVGDRDIHAAPTSAVNVVDHLPASLSLTSIAGAGWSCDLATVSCTRSDGLAVGASFAPITVTVNVAADAPASVVNQATASGGGSTWGNAGDVTNIVP